MHNTHLAVLCLAAVVRSTDAAAPEDEPDGGAKADMLFQVRSGGRAQQAAQAGAPLEESQPHHRYGCDKFTDRTRIRNDEVETELSYARAGSGVPEPFEGLFWMDQRGRNVKPATTGRYRQRGTVAADEVLMSFGDSSWDPQTRCFSKMAPFGGQQGHWTWLDQDERLDNGIYNINCGCQAHIKFCCTDDSCERVDLTSYINPADCGEFLRSNDWHGLGWFGTWLSDQILWALDHLWNGHASEYQLPMDYVMSWHMNKKPWGWDRESVRCPHCYWESWKTYYHYPVFRIVDGDGQRTEHYNAYLEFADEDTGASRSTFQQPMNRGNGTTFVGRTSR